MKDDSRESEEVAQKQDTAKREETTHSAEEGVVEKYARTDRSDTEMDTDAGGEAGTHQLYPKQKKGHIYETDYKTDSDKEAI